MEKLSLYMHGIMSLAGTFNTLELIDAVLHYFALPDYRGIEKRQFPMTVWLHILHKKENSFICEKRGFNF